MMDDRECHERSREKDHYRARTHEQWRELDVVEAFVARLTELTMEYGVVLGGCGCCGSPHMSLEKEAISGRYEFDKDKSFLDKLKWLDADA